MADLMRDKVYNIIARLSRYDKMFKTSGISNEGETCRRSRRDFEKYNSRSKTFRTKKAPIYRFY